MKNELIEILKTLGYPVFLQGSLNPDEEYPETFFTFWNFETPEAGFYDNKASKAVWGFWIYIYSSNPALTDTELEKARQLLKANGWIATDKGQDVQSDEPTHTGRMIESYCIEKY